MDRNREARRGVTIAASNGLSRRRHRSNSLRDSPEEDGLLELQETARLRDRKKDRERDRDRDRERDRERERDRLNRSSKRRRSDKFMHGRTREDGGDDTSEESVNDDEDDDEDDGGVGNSSSMRMLPPNPSTSSSSMLNHQNSNHHHHHHNSNNQNSNSNNNINNNNHHHHNNHSRKSFPSPAKVFRTPTPTVTSTTTTTTTSSTWKAADEMISVSVPRKARSASTKRSHEWASSGGAGGISGGSVVGGEQIHRQASTSPVRPSIPTVMATPAPASPSSNVSVRKKMKPNGTKQRPPKSSSNKSSSSAQDEIEIEIAEVLYGMKRQPQCPSKQEIVGADSVSREISNNNYNNFSGDAKFSVSSPISNSPSTLLQSSSILPTNSICSTAPISAIAPKRKRPRPVKYDDENPSMSTVRNSPISATTKAEIDQSAKTEASLNLEKKSSAASAENGSISYNLGSSQASEPQLESGKPESNPLLANSKGLTEESESSREEFCAAKEEPQSPKKEPLAGLILDDDRRDNMAVTKANSTQSEVEIQREEKFQIDLMAPPPSRSSPEKDSEIDIVAVDLQPGLKHGVKEDGKEVKTVNNDVSIEAEENKAKTVAEESESQKSVVGKERNIDLHRDLEKSDRDSGIGTGSLTGNKLHQHVQKQQQQPQVPEKTAQANSLPLPLSMASWPGGLPPMGYMAPLQGVVSMDGSLVSSAAIQPPHLLFSQPRPKRCATHGYIARNIHYHQQFTKMNPFWPAAAGSTSLYGAKAACNLNVVPPTELHGTFPARSVNTVPDKGQGLAIFPSHSGKDSKSSLPATIMDAAQRKQVLLQQSIPPGAPSNILHAPAFIFPLSQQQAAAAVRPGSVKSPPAASSVASSGASNSATVSASATEGATDTAMSFNYPNMLSNETQYLAFLQNNGYPFPISAHVGAPPAYRGTHAQAMPFFNGSFYSSQMLHPSQLQQQQPQQQLQQQQPLPAQSQKSHQNTSISSGSSSSQKHLPNQQQRPHSSDINGGSGTLQGFPTPKNQPQLQLQQRQQQQNQQVPHQARQLESEMGSEESPSTADSRVSRANMNIYGQNFAMPLHPANFGLLTTASMGGGTSTSEKRPQQQQNSNAGVESLMPQTFAMSFGPINGAATVPGFDISSIAQNPVLLQSLPEAVRHGYQIMAAAQAAQQKKNCHVSEEGKTGGNDTSNVEEERKLTSGKPPATVGQSIAFSRQDLTDAQTFLDSSTRTLNLGPMPARTSVSVMPASMSNANASAVQQQLQRNQQHQQMMQLQKQQQFAAAAAAAQRSKTPSTINGSVYSDHLPASSMAAKFPNALSVFPQNLVQNNSSPTQSPQWKNSGRTSTSQGSSQTLASPTTSSLKNLPQQQGRTQQGHSQISFAANPKSSSTQGQPPPSNNQSASPPMMIGSPTTSSISKTSASGSPRTTATTSTGNRGGQASLSSQQAKNSPSMPSRKSSPVPSILGNPNISSVTTGAKQQMSHQQQQQQQQQLSKHALQQAQLLFSNAAYMQAHAQHAASTTSSASAASGFFMQRHREQQPQQQPGSSALCPPVTHSNSGTSDPAKAVAAASNMKGLSSQGLVHSGKFGTAQSSGKQHQLLPPGYPYVHAVPTPVQVKPAEQKQPAGE